MHGSPLILNMYLIILSSSAANDPHMEREKEGVPVDKKQVPVDRLTFQDSAYNFWLSIYLTVFSPLLGL
jgi:hypothetical protein